MRIARTASLLFAMFVLLAFSTTLTHVAESTQTPTIFVTPSSIQGDGTPAPGSIISVKVNVSDIPDPGLWSYEFKMTVNTTVFPQKVPVNNMNFTATTAWSTLPPTGTGTPTYGYDVGDGNFALGSYFHRANSTEGGTASLTFTTEQTFSWTFTNPLCYIRSYAYRISGNSIATGSKLTVRVVRPDSTYKDLLTKSFTTTEPWSYNSQEKPDIVFNQIGSYKFQLIADLKTATSGTSNYVQVNWDDVGLKIAPVNVTEGPFLQQGGDTLYAAKYYWAGYIIVTNAIQGPPFEPPGSPHPVPGNGTLAFIDLLVDYGKTSLHLYDTKLFSLQLLPPDYPTVPIEHVSIDGFFSNWIRGDMDFDQDVDSTDYFIFKTAYGSSVGQPAYILDADINGDGKVDYDDFYIFAGNYSKEI